MKPELRTETYHNYIAGAFVIPYVIMMTFVGLPVFFLELIVGQYAAAGPLNIWSISPLFQGKETTETQPLRTISYKAIHAVYLSKCQIIVSFPLKCAHQM